MTWCVDKIDAMSAPGERDCRTGDGDAPLDLLRHVVRHSVPVVHIAQHSGVAAVEEHALRRCRLASI